MRTAVVYRETLIALRKDHDVVTLPPDDDWLVPQCFDVADVNFLVHVTLPVLNPMKST